MLGRTACAFLAALVLCSLSYGQKSVKATLTAKYAAVTRAFQHKDLKAFKAMLAADYTATTPDGKVQSREAVLQGLQVQMSNMSNVKWKRTIRSLSVKGRKATAVVDGDFTGQVDMRGPHKFQLLATSRDVWESTKGQWKIKSTNLIKAKTLLDGKPFSRSGA